jgi:hypothetical protein
MATPFLERTVTVAPTRSWVDGNADFAGIQEAIDFVRTRATVADPWVVQLLPGHYLPTAQINATNLSGVRIIGYGKRASIIEAPAALLTTLDASGTDAGAALIDMSGCVECSVETLTVDALTNDPGTLTGLRVAGVYVQNCVEVTFTSCDLRGVFYGLWENSTAAGLSIDVFNCTCRAAGAATRSGSAIWHVFGSDIEGHLKSGGSLFTGNYVTAFYCNNSSAAINTTFWGCHLHAETEIPVGFSCAAIVSHTAGAGSKIFVVGSTIHAKTNSEITGSACAPVAAIGIPSRDIRMIGCDLLLETGTVTLGTYGGIVVLSTGSPIIDLVGCNFFDVSGASTGQAKRGAIIKTGGGTPVFNIVGGNFDNTGVGIITSGGSFNSSKFPGSTTGSIALSAGVGKVSLLGTAVNKGGAAATSFTNGNTAVTGSGTAFLTDFKVGDYIRAASHDNGAWTQINAIASDTSMTLVEGYRGATLATTQAQVAVTVGGTQPNATYQIVTGSGVTGETFSVTAKHQSGFTITSSNGASTATVDWILSR